MTAHANMIATVLQGLICTAWTALSNLQRIIRHLTAVCILLQAGYYCQVCDCILRDSQSYLDHMCVFLLSQIKPIRGGFAKLTLGMYHRTCCPKNFDVSILKHFTLGIYHMCCPQEMPFKSPTQSSNAAFAEMVNIITGRWV